MLFTVHIGALMIVHVFIVVDGWRIIMEESEFDEIEKTKQFAGQ